MVIVYTLPLIQDYARIRQEGECEKATGLSVSSHLLKSSSPAGGVGHRTVCSVIAGHLKVRLGSDKSNRTIDVTGMKINKETEISEVWRKCPSRVYSSAHLEWKGIVVEHHLVPPGEKPRTTTRHNIVELAVGGGPTYGECLNQRGTFPLYIKPLGEMNIYPQGVLPFLCTSTQTEMIVCALDRDLVARIADEEEVSVPAALHEVIGFRDEGTAGLIRLLDEEARTGGRLGPRYSEHLVHALTRRLLFINTAKQARISSAALPPRRLQRVLDRMMADLSADLDLHSLAKESGYSRSHFLRMFREATGVTPYQCLLRLRLQQAERMIEEAASDLVDIAFACGFSSHTHMSRMFRQVIGITPSEYRRNVHSGENFSRRLPNAVEAVDIASQVA
jgi:AraC family transcriptional regulator